MQFITQAGMFDSIHAANRAFPKRGVAPPDFRQTNYYAPQWRCFGALNYYQQPKEWGGKVIAAYSIRDETQCVFDSNGLSMDTLLQLFIGDPL